MKKGEMSTGAGVGPVERERETQARTMVERFNRLKKKKW